MLASCAVALAAAFALVLNPQLLMVGGLAAITFWFIALSWTQTDRLLVFVPFLVLLAHTSFRDRDPAALLGGDLDPQVIFQLGLYGLVALLAVAGLCRRANDAVRIPGGNPFAMAYVLLAAASVAWASYPFVTLPRAAQLATLYLVCWAAARRLGRTRLLHSLAISAVIYVLLFSLLAVLFASAQGIGLTYGGVARFSWLAVHPGLAGTYAAMGALYVLSLTLLRPRHSSSFLTTGGGWLLVSVLVVILFATRARTTAFAFLAGAAVLMITRLATGRLAFVASLAVGVLLTMIGALVLPDVASAWLADAIGSRGGSTPWLVGFVSRGETLDEIWSVTGRRDLWRFALRLILDRPILGHGYVASRGLLLTAPSWGAGESHNGLVEVLLGLGVIGLFLLAFAFLRAFLLALREASNRSSVDRPVHAWSLSTLVFLLVHAFVSDSVAGPPGISVMAFFAVAIAYGARGSRAVTVIAGRSRHCGARPVDDRSNAEMDGLQGCER